MGNDDTTDTAEPPLFSGGSDKYTRTIDIGGPSPKRIFDQVSIVAIVLDTNMRIVRYNAAAERLFDRPFSEVLNRNFDDALDLIADINRDHVFQRVIGLNAPAEVKEVEVHDKRMDRTLYFDFVIDPIVDDDGRMAGLSLIGLDVTERALLRRRLAEQNEDLFALQRVGQALRKTMDLEKAFFIIASALTSHEAGAYERAMIFTVDQDREYLIGRICADSVNLDQAVEGLWRGLVSHEGPLKKTLDSMMPVLAKRWGELSDVVQRVRIPLTDDKSLLVHAIRTGETVTHDTLEQEPQLRLHPDMRSRFDMSCFAAAPLLAEREAIGLIIVDSTNRPRDFTPERLKLLEMFADQAALAINNGLIFQNVLNRAQKDSLTGLFNHGHFQEVLKAELEKAERYGNEVSMILLDIDHFKGFNDTHGHQTGDAVLKQVAMLLGALVRVTDLPARYGGEEFAVILPHTDYKGALEMAERLRIGIERKVQVKSPKGEKLGVTASFGVSTYPRHAADPGVLVAQADEALYIGKERGRNCVVGADETEIEVQSKARKRTGKPKRTMTITRVESKPVKSRKSTKGKPKS
jgi:diguanylate cyclase (GGDEF)-like protein